VPAGRQRPAREKRLDGGVGTAVGVRAEHAVADAALDDELRVREHGDKRSRLLQRRAQVKIAREDERRDRG
jgi:hypothetical protein